MEVVFDQSHNGVLFFPNMFINRVQFLGLWQDDTNNPAFGSKEGSVGASFSSFQNALDTFITALQSSGETIGYFAIQKGDEIYWQTGSSLDWQNGYSQIDTENAIWQSINDANTNADISLNLLDHPYIFSTVGGTLENAVYRIDLTNFINLDKFALQHSPEYTLDYRYDIIDTDTKSYYIKVNWPNYRETIEQTRKRLATKTPLSISTLPMSYDQVALDLNVNNILIDNDLFVEYDDSQEELHWYADISNNFKLYQYSDTNRYFQINREASTILFPNQSNIPNGSWKTSFSPYLEQFEIISSDGETYTYQNNFTPNINLVGQNSNTSDIKIESQLTLTQSQDNIEIDISSNSILNTHLINIYQDLSTNGINSDLIYFGDLLLKNFKVVFDNEANQWTKTIISPIKSMIIYRTEKEKWSHQHTFEIDSDFSGNNNMNNITILYQTNVSTVSIIGGIAQDQLTVTRANDTFSLESFNQDEYVFIDSSLNQINQRYLQVASDGNQNSLEFTNNSIMGQDYRNENFSLYNILFYSLRRINSDHTNIDTSENIIQIDPTTDISVDSSQNLIFTFNKNHPGLTGYQLLDISRNDTLFFRLGSLSYNDNQSSHITLGELYSLVVNDISSVIDEENIIITISKSPDIPHKNVLKQLSDNIKLHKSEKILIDLSHCSLNINQNDISLNTGLSTLTFNKDYYNYDLSVNSLIEITVQNKEHTLLDFSLNRLYRQYPNTIIFDISNQPIKYPFYSIDTFGEERLGSQLITKIRLSFSH